jgi:hypothetical protein
MGHKVCLMLVVNGLKIFVYNIDDVFNVRFDNSKIIMVQISCLHIMFGIFYNLLMNEQSLTIGLLLT